MYTRRRPITAKVFHDKIKILVVIQDRFVSQYLNVVFLLGVDVIFEGGDFRNRLFNPKHYSNSNYCDIVTL